MRLHAHEFGREPETRRALVELRPLLRARAKEARDVMGFNLAGMRALRGYIRDNDASSNGVTGTDPFA